MNPIAKISDAIHVVFYGSSIFGLAGTLHLVQWATLVIKPFSERLVVKINSKIAGIIWSCMQYIFERRKKAHITFSGDILPKGESALVISNHQSWTDLYMIHSVAIRHDMLANCKYFVKDSIKWIPFFGLGMKLAGFIYVSRNWTQDQSKIHNTFRDMKRLETPAWVINYVEGSRATPQKIQEAQAFSKQRNYSIMKHVLLPRTKGFITCVNEFRDSHIKYVYDLTIGYRHTTNPKAFLQAPSMIRAHIQPLWPEYEFHIHVRRYAIQDLPKEEEKLGHWLRERWVEKDHLLDELKENWTVNLLKQA